jgi:hypothetical protein
MISLDVMAYIFPYRVDQKLYRRLNISELIESHINVGSESTFRYVSPLFARDTVPMAEYILEAHRVHNIQIFIVNFINYTNRYTK